MIITQQMQDAVGDQKQIFTFQAVSVILRLFRNIIQVDEDVADLIAEIRKARYPVIVGETDDVRGPIQLAIIPIDESNCFAVGQDDRIAESRR